MKKLLKILVKLLKILANHALLLISASAIILLDLLFIYIGNKEEMVAVLMFTPIFMFFFLIVVFLGIYAFLFFRKENFLTPLLPISLILLSNTKLSVTSLMYSAWFTKSCFGLITFLICFLIRLTAFLLIRKHKEKLQNWTGEEKITSDIVFWVKVLSKKLIKSIKPKSNI